MMTKPDLIQSEILPTLRDGSPNPEFPHGGFCQSGHLVPKGTRFFHVSGPVLDKVRSGIYCEPCLKVANKLRQYRKENKLLDFHPLAELLNLLKEEVEKHRGK